MMGIKLVSFIFCAGLLGSQVLNSNAQKTTKQPFSGTKITTQQPFSGTKITTKQPFWGTKITTKQPFSGTKITTQQQSSKSTFTTPQSGSRPTFTTPQSGSRPTFTTPQSWSRPTFTTPQPWSRPTFSTPQPWSMPSFTTPQSGSRPTFTTPQSGSRPTFTTPQSGSRPTFTTPQSGSRPTFTTPLSGSRPTFTTPQSGSRPTFTTPQSGSRPTFTTPQSGSRPTFTTPQSGSRPTFTTPQSGSRPTFTTPLSGSRPTFTTRQPLTRPTVPSTRTPLAPKVPSGSTVPVDYPCPRECQACQLYKDPTKNCIAYDKYGSVRQKFYGALSTTMKDHYDFLANTSLFETTAYMSTCAGLKFYLGTWASMTKLQQAKLIDLIRDPTTVTAQAMKVLPKVAFAILKPMVEKSMYRRMTDQQKIVMCSNLNYADCFTKVAINNNLPCGKLLLASGTADAKTLASVVDVSNCSNWDKSQWNLTMKYSPELLDMECLKQAPPDVMVSNVDSLSQHCDKLDKRSINILANITTTKLIEEKKAGRQISTTEKDQLADLLTACGVDPSIMGELMDKSEMLEKIDFSKTDTKKGIKYMKEVLKTVNPRDLNKEQIVNSFKMMVYNRTLLEELDVTALKDAVCDICDKADSFDKADLSKLTKVILDRVPSLADPSTYDQATLDCIGPLLQFLPMTSFDTIPASSLQDAMSNGKMKNVTVTSKKMGKKLLYAAKTALSKSGGAFTSDDLEKIGSSVVAMDASDIENIPSNSFSDSVIELFADNIKKGKSSDVKPSKSMISSIMKKIKNSPTAVKKAIESGLGDDIPTEFLKNADINDLPDITGDSTEVTIEVDEKKAKILLEKVKEKIGDTSGSDTNFTLQRLSNIKNIACGLTIEDIKNITNDGERVDKMNAITQSPCIKKEQVDAAKKAFKESTNFDSSTEAEVESDTDSGTLSQTSPKMLSQFSYAELKKFGQSNKDAIVNVIAQTDKEVISKTQMKDGFKFVMEARGKSSSGDITKDDLDSAANLVCGIDSASLSRLDSDALDEYSTTIDKCPLDKTERTTLGSTLMSKLDLTDSTKVDATSIMTLGTSVSEMTDSQLDSIDRSVLCDMSDKVASAFKDKEEQESRRKKKGFKMDTTSDDESTFKANKKRVMKKLLSVQDACTSSSSSSSSGRKKRSTTSLTCTYMRNIGTSGLSALTIDQINNLDDTEFTDCIDILGAVTDYSTAQKEALANVAKRNTVYGTPTTWTAATVTSCGVIVQGLTVAEIGTMTFDLDAISKLGEFDGWTDSQKMAVFDRWLVLTKSSDASTITSSELRSLGHMTCGATTSHISVIPHSIYSSSADAVGEVTSCSASQLTSFASLAKTAYNGVTTWGASTVSNVGVVIGGITKAELASLTESQIDNIDPNHVTYIPANIFSGLTTAQISTLSASQAQSTTADQRSSLDSSQLAALSAVAGTTFSSSGVMIQTSWSVAVLLCVISMYFKI